MLQIYITDLAAYNAGHLIGEFISLPKDENELMEDINRILGKGERICKSFPHEEIFISDYEWEDIEIFKIEEFNDIQLLNKKLFFLQNEVAKEDFIKVNFLLDHGLASSIEDSVEKIDNLIFYPSITMVEFAEEFVENNFDLDKVPEIIRYHIDYKGIARDLKIDGSFFEVSDGIFEYLD